MKGKFIVLDGLDGCGKTTHALKLLNWLALDERFKSCQLVYAREPTSSEAGLKFRALLTSMSNPKQQAQLLCQLAVKDRAEHCKKLLLPALEAGCIVICDRYSYSTFAYQQAQGLSFEQIMAEHRKHKILKPDLALILDLPPKIALQRISARKKLYVFEQLDFLEQVRACYLKLKELLPDENIAIINAARPLNKVFEEVKAIVEQFLSKEK